MSTHPTCFKMGLHVYSPASDLGHALQVQSDSQFIPRILRQYASSFVFTQYKSRMSFTSFSYIEVEFGQLHLGEAFFKLQIIIVHAL